MRLLNRVNEYLRPATDFVRDRLDRNFATNVVSLSMFGMWYGSPGMLVTGAGRASTVIYRAVGATTNALGFSTAIVASQTAAVALINGVEWLFSSRKGRTTRTEKTGSLIEVIK